MSTIAVPDVSTFEAKLAEAGDKLVLIDFHAVWCGPCKKIAPFLEELAKKYEDELVVIKVDVDEIDELAKSYKVDVMPTFVFKRKGEHLDTVTGSNEEKLKVVLEQHLAKK